VSGEVAHLKALSESRSLPVTNHLVAYKGEEGKINAKNFNMGSD